jgi:AraC family transcriptional regulator
MAQICHDRCHCVATRKLSDDVYGAMRSRRRVAHAVRRHRFSLGGGRIAVASVGSRQFQHQLVDFSSIGSSERFRFTEKLNHDGVVLARCVLQPNIDGHIAFSKTTVAIHDGAPLEMEWRPPESDRIRSSMIRRGGAMLVDGDVPVWKRWRAPRSIFAFAMDDAFVAQVWRSAFDGVGERAIRTAVNIDDPIIAHLCDVGQRELNMGGPGGRLYLEGLGTALTVHLLRTQGAAKRAPLPHKGGLAPARLRRVVEFIAAHLEGEIALTDLATVAELSTHHFGAAFKASTGRSPHGYVMDRRVERARELLRAGARPIAEIAYAAGFSSQAHLTTNFRRVIGITPGRFRRSLG